MTRALHFERPLSKEIKNIIRDIVHDECNLSNRFSVVPQIAVNNNNQ